MRVVLDTNIWISSILSSHSKAGRIMAAWRASQFDIVTSPPILEEIKRVLSYPKIKKHHGFEDKVLDQYVLLLQFFTEVIELKPAKNPVSVRDANDVPILHTFIQSKADYLVTGDDDLLVLKNQYPILTLSEFHARL